MNANTRRSERLRRKRQSTPGLSQPGNYTLYDSGYVVESETSFLPDIHAKQQPPTPASNRRIRYKDSPHVFDVSPIIADDHPDDDDDDYHQQHDQYRQPPPDPSPGDQASPRSRAHAVVDRVRVSLFDILSSAARRPVSTTWRRQRGSAEYHQAQKHGKNQPHEQQEQEDILVDEPEIQPQRLPSTGAVRNLGIAFDSSTRIHAAASVVSRTVPSSTVVIALLTLLVLSIPLLISLDATVKARTSQSEESAWQSIRARCDAVSCAARPKLRVASARTAATMAALRNLLSRPWRWGVGIRTDADVMTRASFEANVLPDVLRRARAEAAEEALRVSRVIMSDVGRRGAVTATGGEIESASRKAAEFAEFVERFAADKDLPADYALSATGSFILWSKPSIWAEYARFVRDYVGALATDGKITPGLPRRARMILEADVLPGSCWAFPGAEAEVAVKFGRPVRARSVTMEHTPRASVFSMDSAPRRFSVVGVRLKGEKVMLGEFEFLKDGPHLQRFVVDESAVGATLRGVVLQVLSNWGAAHTTVYRLRVHGEQVALGDLGN